MNSWEEKKNRRTERTNERERERERTQRQEKKKQGGGKQKAEGGTPVPQQRASPTSSPSTAVTRCRNRVTGRNK